MGESMGKGAAGGGGSRTWEKNRLGSSVMHAFVKPPRLALSELSCSVASVIAVNASSQRRPSSVRLVFPKNQGKKKKGGGRG